MLRRSSIVLLVTVLFFFAFYISINALGTNYQETCPAGSVEPGCQPPKISDIQIFVVQLIGTAWALGGLIFGMLLMYNGTLYLMGYFEELKFIMGASIEDAQKRMVQWGVGFLLFFISYPIMNSMLKFMVGENVDCYNDLRVPGFTFIFYDICILPTDTPTPTVTPSP